MTIPEAHEYCIQKTKQSGSNFYYSFYFLPKPRREAMYTIYTFCHEVDDTVDHPSSDIAPQAQLEQWRQEIAAMYEGRPSFPVTISLEEHVKTFHIPQHYLQELINGMEMDLTITRYATFQDLYPYCYRVASIVGLICLKAFGTQSDLAEEYATHLGLAFQLTNILRDISPDADRNRIYLPQEDLERFDYSEQDLLTKTYSPQFVKLMAFQCERAEQFYQQAQAVFRRLSRQDRQSLIAAEVMRGVYSRILKRIISSKYHVFGPRIRIHPAQRVAIALLTWAGTSLQTRLVPQE